MYGRFERTANLSSKIMTYECIHWLELWVDFNIFLYYIMHLANHTVLTPPDIIQESKLVTMFRSKWIAIIKNDIES
jgi:hypothetical protein